MKRTTKRLVWIVIVFAVIAYFVNDYLEDRSRKKAEKAKEEQIEKITRATVSQLVSKTNAIDNWDELLSEGADTSFKKILTIDLEKVWLGNRPILFIGYVDNVATYDNQYYILKVDQGLTSSLQLLDTSLSLELKCDKKKVDSFIEKHPDIISDIGLENNIAIVVKIEEIKTAYYLSGEGDKEEVKIGKGYCIDMVFIGDVDLRHITTH